MWRLQPDADTKVIPWIANDPACRLKGRKGPLSIGYALAIPNDPGFMSLVKVCMPCSNLECAATVCLVMLAHSMAFPEVTGLAHCASLAIFTFECPALQAVLHRHAALFGAHARTMVQFIWQDDLYAIARFIRDCLDVYHSADLPQSQASDQP
jgi:hypothetical protein